MEISFIRCMFRCISHLWGPAKAQQRESVSLSEKSRLSVAISSGFGSEVSRDTPPSMPLQLPPDMKRQVSPDMKRQVSPGMKRQVSPGTPRVHGTSSRLTTVSMRWGWWGGG